MPTKLKRIISGLCCAVTLVLAVALALPIGAEAIFADAPVSPEGKYLEQSAASQVAYAAETDGSSGDEYAAFELTAEEKKMLAGLSGKEIKLGCFSTLSYFRDKEGNELGGSIPIVNLLRSWGLTIIPERIEYPQDYPAWKSDDIDLYFVATVTRDLAETYACTNGFIETNILSITKKDQSIDDIASTTGKKIGVIPEVGIQEALAPFHDSDEPISVYPSIEDLLEALEQGEIDVAFSSYTLQTDVAGHAGLSYKIMNGTAPFVKGLAATSEDMRPVIDLLNRYIAGDGGSQLKRAAADEIDKALVVQLQAKLADQISALQGTYAQIRVLGSEFLYPFCFRKDGTLQGAAPGALELFSKVTGIPVEYVTRVDFKEESALDVELSQGKIQVTAGVYRDLVPGEKNEFSDPLFKDSAMLYKLANRDFGEKRVADLKVGVAGDLYPYVQWQKFFGDVPTMYRDGAAGLDALQQGDIDLILVGSACIDYRLVMEDFSYERFDDTEIALDMRLNYNSANIGELNFVLDEVVALYNSSYAYQLADGDKEVLDYQQEYIRVEADQRDMTSQFEASMLWLVVLLLVAAFLFYYQYRRYSKYDNQIKRLIGNQKDMDIGFGDLRHDTLSSKGDWAILRKVGIDIPHIETMPIDEMSQLMRMDVRGLYQDLVADMRAKGEKIRTWETEHSNKGRRIVLSQTVFLLSKHKFDFYTTDITSAKEEADSLKELAECDHLTKAYRRKAFIDRASQLRDEADGPLYVSIVDIDLFKEVNDAYGHETGDKTILMVVDQMTQDFASSGIVGRWGGEEFVALYSASNDEEAVQKLEECLNLASMRHIAVDPKTGNSIHVTVSGGVTEWKPGEDLNFAISEADAALYVSKKNGRNRVTIFDGTEGQERRDWFESNVY